MIFKRIHDRGSESLLIQYSDGWRIRLHLRDSDHNPVTIAGYLKPTLESAKELADAELLKLGHVCNSSCQGWKEEETTQEPRGVASSVAQARYPGGKKREHFITLRLKRVHDTGTQVHVRQCEEGWHMSIDLREANHDPMTITDYLVPTVERAKELADQELRKYGHVCKGSCPDWIEFLLLSGDPS